MQTEAPPEPTSSLEKITLLIVKYQQLLKLTVYSLLILNFGYYVFDDWRAAQSTLQADATFLQIMAAYVTSIDEVAWFVILGLLEYETYWMDDDAKSGFSFWLLQGLRVGCYGLLCHTLYAYCLALADLGQAEIIAGVSNVCDLAGQNLYLVRNLLYEPIELTTCANLSSGNEFYKFIDEPVVADAAGYSLEIQHAWVDVMDTVCWLSISLSMTFIVILHDRKILKSMWITGADRIQIICYTALICEAGYWAAYEFYVYTWDTLLWIGGFAAIDANLSQWREDLKDESEQKTAEI